MGEILIYYAITTWGLTTGMIVGLKRDIEMSRYHSKSNPSGYMMPSKNFCKFFRLERKKIPKMHYRLFYLSFVYMGLFMVTALLYLFYYANEISVDTMVLVSRVCFAMTLIIGACESICIGVVSWLYDK